MVLPIYASVERFDFRPTIAAADLLGGAKNFMIGSLIEEQFKGNAGNWPFSAAASMILLTMVLILLLILAQRRRS